MSLQTFSNNLKFLSKTKGLTPEKLAIRMHLKSKRVRAWFEGRAYPRIEQLKRLADILETTIDELTTSNMEETEIKTWQL